MAESNSHIIYTAKDIQRYLEGKMSNEEMHAIEKAALDDPLLAEAIEGYAGVDEKDWRLALGDLRSKIGVAENAPVIPLKSHQSRRVWRIAAAILVLVSGVGIPYLFKGQKDAVSIAEHQSKPTTSDLLQRDSIAVASKNPLEKVDSEKIAVTTEPQKSTELNVREANSTLTAPQSIKESDAENKFVYTPKTKSQEKPVVSGGGADNYSSGDNAINAAPGYNNNAGRLSNEGISSSTVSDDNLKKSNTFNDQDFLKSYKAPATNNSSFNSFNGLVVTKDNTPLAFAQVKTNASRQPVYTDKNGFFKITSPDTVLQARIISAGYESKSVTIRQSGVHEKVVLEPVTIAEKKLSSGKVNTDIAKAKSRMEQQKEIEEQEEDEATPVNGWEDYNNYLNTNGNISNKNIHGVVEVFVNLDKNGAVSKIKVDKSLCAECDAEAVRLVKEGPKWDVKTNKARKVKVKVKF